MASKATVASHRIYDGRVISLDVDQVRFPDGSVGEQEIVRHPGACAIIPFLSDEGASDPIVLLLRQYRYAADGYLYEIPAGRMNPGETPVMAAARELKEETGCVAARLEPLFSMLTTPGFTDEEIHTFIATGITHGDAETEADEFLEVVTMPLSQALRMIQQGEIRDSKTALAILYAAGFTLGA